MRLLELNKLHIKYITWAMSESPGQISRHLLTLSKWPHPACLWALMSKKKGEARDGERKSLLLINGGRRRGVSGPRVEMERGCTPTAGLHTVNTERTRQRSSTEIQHGGEHVGKLCFLARSQSVSK